MFQSRSLIPIYSSIDMTKLCHAEHSGAKALRAILACMSTPVSTGDSVHEHVMAVGPFVFAMAQRQFLALGVRREWKTILHCFPALEDVMRSRYFGESMDGRPTLFHPLELNMWRLYKELPRKTCQSIARDDVPLAPLEAKGTSRVWNYHNIQLEAMLGCGANRGGEPWHGTSLPSPDVEEDCTRAHPIHMRGNWVYTQRHPIDVDIHRIHVANAMVGRHFYKDAANTAGSALSQHSKGHDGCALTADLRFVATPQAWLALFTGVTSAFTDNTLPTKAHRWLISPEMVNAARRQGALYTQSLVLAPAPAPGFLRPIRDLDSTSNLHDVLRDVPKGMLCPVAIVLDDLTSSINCLVGKQKTMWQDPWWIPDTYLSSTIELRNVVQSAICKGMNINTSNMARNISFPSSFFSSPQRTHAGVLAVNTSLSLAWVIAEDVATGNEFRRYIQQSIGSSTLHKFVTVSKCQRLGHGVGPATPDVYAFSVGMRNISR